MCRFLKFKKVPAQKSDHKKRHKKLKIKNGTKNKKIKTADSRQP
jgi:hypothetical protein